MPKFLFVDDETGDVASEYGPIGSDSIRVRTPGALRPHDLDWSDVVLCDFNLSEFDPPDENVPLNTARDGIALTATLRSFFETADSAVGHRLRGFALFTGDANKISSLPQGYRDHAAAKALNVDWIFDKPKSKDGRVELGRRLVSWAEAICELPNVWPEARAERWRTIRQLVRLPTLEWSDRAWSDMAEQHPPMRDLADATRGRAFFRWLLQDAIPYPTFIFSDPYLAARLRVDPDRLEYVLHASDSRLERALQSARYSGILENFVGRRWWYAGVEQVLFELTGQRPFDIDTLAGLAGDSSRGDADELVVTLGRDLQPERQLGRVSEVKKVLVPGWPPDAQQPYMRPAIADEVPDLIEETSPAGRY